MSIGEILTAIVRFVSETLMPILTGLAFVAFLYNLSYFIYNSDNKNEQVQFKRYMVNSVIALFILLSAWGIVGLGTRAFFNGKPYIPQLPTQD